MSSPGTECQTEAYYTPQLKTQDEFWTATIQSYRLQIKHLEDEKEYLLNTLDQTEFTMLPFMTFFMAKLYKTAPNLNVNSLLGDIKPYQAKSKRPEADLPDLKDLKEFTMQDNDLLYMKIIESLATRTKDLQGNIDHLHDREKELLQVKENVEYLVGTSQREKSNKNILIRADLIKDLNLRLSSDNIRMQKEISESRCQMLFLQDQIIEAVKQIEKEQAIENVMRSRFEMQKINNGTVDGKSRIQMLKQEYDATKQEISKLNSLHEELKKELQTLWAQGDKLTKEFKRKNNDHFDDILAKYMTQELAVDDINNAEIDKPDNTYCKCKPT